ncbi:MAG: 2Fe-2S iron-sulfur cluster-binding protein [Verrucomicrobia bacterium]|nr:2Fe-2S iron-sulfur cluster-binding protein [Verrucomicrobiota bacterium]
MNKLSPNEVSFFLNGKSVTIKKAAPDMLLIDYLRSPEVALAGPKKPCGQGGCGGCTVILSHWNEDKKAPEHPRARVGCALRTLNSCFTRRLPPVVRLRLGLLSLKRR